MIIVKPKAIVRTTLANCDNGTTPCGLPSALLKAVRTKRVQAETGK